MEFCTWQQIVVIHPWVTLILWSNSKQNKKNRSPFISVLTPSTLIGWYQEGILPIKISDDRNCRVYCACHPMWDWELSNWLTMIKAITTKRGISQAKKHLVWLRIRSQCIRGVSSASHWLRMYIKVLGTAGCSIHFSWLHRLRERGKSI